MGGTQAEKIASISFGEYFKKLYKKDKPTLQELVIGRVIRIEPHGIYIYLDEYDLEAYVPLKELSTKLVNHPREVVKLYQRVVARIYKMDRRGVIINASLRRVLSSERDKKLQEWRKMRRVLILLQQMADSLGVSIDEVIEKVARPVLNTYGSVYDGFEEAVKWGEEVLEEAGVPKEWIPRVMDIIRANIKPKELVARFEVRIRTLAPDGVIRIRKAFEKAVAVSPDKIFVEYISAPRYLVKVRGFEWKEVAETFMEFFNTLKTVILSNNRWPTEVEYEAEDKKLKAKKLVK